MGGDREREREEGCVCDKKKIHTYIKFATPTLSYFMIIVASPVSMHLYPHKVSIL